MTRPTPAPRSGVLEAGQRRRLDDAGYDAIATPQYPTSAPPGIHPSRCPCLVTWLRCRACQRGYFAACAPSPQSCPACADGWLLPVGLWDLRTEAAPAGILVHAGAQEGQS
jgi:hypothetical protein